MKSLYLYAFIFMSTAPIGHAADVMIYLTGNITRASCDIDTNDTNIPVSLGDYSISDFKSVGAVGESKSFTINLEECSSTISIANFTFSGDENNENRELLALSSTQGSGQKLATGIGIELLDSSDQPIAINSTNNKYHINPGGNEFLFKLRYKSTLANVTPGDASAVMFFDVTYE